MKLRNLVCSTIVVSLLAGCSSEKGEREESQAQLKAEAKVSQPDAERIALAQAPNGTIKSSEIEREKGKLMWSFDIATPGTTDITEVNVDAITGALVGVEKESAAKEKKEAEDEKSEKK